MKCSYIYIIHQVNVGTLPDKRIEFFLINKYEFFITHVHNKNIRPSSTLNILTPYIYINHLIDLKKHKINKIILSKRNVNKRIKGNPYHFSSLLKIN